MDIDDMVDVHGPLKSVNDVVEELSVNNDYDLIFSDIRLLDGDVFEAFRKVRPNSFVIFKQHTMNMPCKPSRTTDSTIL